MPCLWHSLLQWHLLLPCPMDLRWVSDRHLLRWISDRHLLRRCRSRRCLRQRSLHRRTDLHHLPRPTAPHLHRHTAPPLIKYSSFLENLYIRDSRFYSRRKPIHEWLRQLHKAPKKMDISLLFVNKAVRETFNNLVSSPLNNLVDFGSRSAGRMFGSRSQFA